MRPFQPRRARLALVHRLAESRRLRGGAVFHGHHNTNQVLPLGLGLALLTGAAPFTRGKLRVPRETVEVVPRIWPRESEVLRVVTRHLPEVPRCLADLGDRSLHVFRPGRSLAEAAPDGVGDELLRALAGFFARTARIPAGELPPRPDGWPDDGDSGGFLRRLAAFTEDRVHRPNRARFGSLFDDVLVPRNAMTSFARSLPGLTSRPFRLLHTDVHRANVIALPAGGLAVIDWELALYGDPLHDLATHLVRMGYGESERERMTVLWESAMRASGQTALTAGLAEDLPVYLAFEHAQSVYPDVMRAALALPRRPDDGQFADAARRTCVAVGLASGPLRLPEVPDPERTEKALRTWHAEDVAVHGRRDPEPAGGDGASAYTADAYTAGAYGSDAYGAGA
ncbi:aminoglycoside phosphotransferase family protein [Streptomyces sp. NPDC059785]|uniref:aminoglycoside phosphotransferase family protein n=1 Tax=unclassified Streptomyces TaxID=2593676 RepID=UPI003650A16C